MKDLRWFQNFCHHVAEADLAHETPWRIWGYLRWQIVRYLLFSFGFFLASQNNKIMESDQKIKTWSLQSHRYDDEAARLSISIFKDGKIFEMLSPIFSFFCADSPFKFGMGMSGKSDGPSFLGDRLLGRSFSFAWGFFSFFFCRRRGGTWVFFFFLEIDNFSFYRHLFLVRVLRWGMCWHLPRPKRTGLPRFRRWSYRQRCSES